MSSRFYSETPIAFPAADPVRLTGGEAHHFLHVMRGGVGDRVTLFDGSGAEFPAEAVEIGRREVALAVLAREEVDREAAVGVTLGVALPKGDRQKVLVEKLTELGVRRLTPLVAERSVAAPKASGLEKLRRGVVEACKQCGRNRLMRIDEPTPLAEFLQQTEAESRWIAHPPAQPPTPAPPTAAPEPGAQAPGVPPGAAPTTVAIAIGPEGGFSEAEVQAAAAAGWGRLSLGRAVLRIETAAIAAAARWTAQ